MKYYKVVNKSLTKWGAPQSLIVSFQKLGNSYCCFQGDGSETNIIGWGNTEKKAAGNLVSRKYYFEIEGAGGIHSVKLLNQNEK